MNKTDKLNCLTVDHDWTLPMINDFIKALMTATLCTDVNELKNHTIIECVWIKVAKDIKIDHNSLKNFWYYRLHMQLFCAEPIYLNDVKIKLIEYLYNKGISSKKDIKWRNVLSHFNGYTQPFLYRIFTYLVRTTQSKTGFTDIADIIHYLYITQIPNIVQNVEDKILPRLMYKDGNIEHIDIDVKDFSPRSVASDESDSFSEKE